MQACNKISENTFFPECLWTTASVLTSRKIIKNCLLIRSSFLLQIIYLLSLKFENVLQHIMECKYNRILTFGFSDMAVEMMSLIQRLHLQQFSLLPWHHHCHQQLVFRYSNLINQRCRKTHQHFDYFEKIKLKQRKRNLVQYYSR